MRKLTMLVGVPGSGKSTVREQLLKEDPDAIVVSFDDLKEQLYGPGGEFEKIGYQYNGDYEKASRANPQFLDLAKKKLLEEIKNSDKNVIFDAMFGAHS